MGSPSAELIIEFSLQVNVALNYVEMSKDKKAQVRRTQQSKPLYVHSQDQ